MSSKPWSGKSRRQRVDDALAAIAAIRDYVREMSAASFCADRKTTSAVEREIMIISEAVTKLVDLEAELSDEQRFEMRFPEVKVQEVRGMGNLLRHEYGRSDPQLVWETVTGRDLDTLQSALERY